MDTGHSPDTTFFAVVPLQAGDFAVLNTSSHFLDSELSFNLGFEKGKTLVNAI